MQKEIEIAVVPERIKDESYILQQGAQALKIDPTRILGLHIRKRSIDARGKQVLYRLRVVFYIDEVYTPEIFSSSLPNVQQGKPVIIIGAGPAGLFAAVRCIERGLKPIIIERGKAVQDRRRDL